MSKPGKKSRLDRLLVDKGLASDIKEAQAFIMSGLVQIENNPNILKPGLAVDVDAPVHVRAQSRYVSRGGEKLKAALDFWGIVLKNQVCLDIGSSTGGFTDCMLQEGARHVYAVDVGTGQADPKIRSHVQVSLFERTHFLEWRPEWDKGVPEFITVDVSFISVSKIFSRMREVLKPGAEAMVLVKPQFEAPAKDLRKGIVKDEAARQSAIESIVRAAEEIGFKVKGRFPCPVWGAQGNQEEWLYLKI